jgi:sialic acid synthase SpsE
LQNTQSIPKINIGGRIICAQQPCYVIAEIGVNHNGSIAIAHQLIDEAKKAGADAAKFQMFNASSLASRDAKKADYQIRETGNGSQLDMLEELTLTQKECCLLKAHCDEVGLDFICTAFDTESLEKVIELGPVCLKWPSGEINNYQFLEIAGKANLPLILSTGMASISEIAKAIDVFESVNSHSGIAILQCVSSYPAPAASQNLKCIDTMASTFRKPTGFSDHTDGTACLLAARAFGMSVLEKHFTLDREMPGPDQKASMLPFDFSQMIVDLREVESAIGDGVKKVAKIEEKVKMVARKSLVYTRDLPKGHLITENDLQAKRPGTGLSPSSSKFILGRCLKTSRSKDILVSLNDFI